MPDLARSHRGLKFHPRSRPKSVRQGETREGTWRRERNVLPLPSRVDLADPQQEKNTNRRGCKTERDTAKFSREREASAHTVEKKNLIRK